MAAITGIIKAPQLAVRPRSRIQAGIVRYNCPEVRLVKGDIVSGKMEGFVVPSENGIPQPTHHSGLVAS